MKWSLVLFLALFFVACQPPPATKCPVAPVAPPPEETMSVAVSMAKKHLAQKLGIAEVEITLVRVDEVVWPDTSLGVPEPGKYYLDVMVPGFRIVLFARGKEYIYHVGRIVGEMVVALASEREELTSLVSPIPLAEAVALAKKHLAQKLRIAETEITLVRADDVIWPDSSLGLPEPGGVYLQVLVPGYRIVLFARGKEYVYHAGGRRVIPVPEEVTTPRKLVSELP